MISKRYRITEEIGAGGIGKVLKAVDLLRQETVAMKVLLSLEPEFISRFKAEFTLLKKLHHPNIIKVFDFGFSDRQELYFTMEYVESIRWQEFLQPLDFPKFYSLLLQILSALDFLHSKKIIHGDIKPSNILVATSPDGGLTLKFTDFGFAQHEKPEESSWWKGTLPYLAPEIIRGEKQTPQADLHSVGVLIYEILFGKPPFEEEDPMALAKSHLEKEVVIPQEPPIPTELRNLILKLLEKDPIDRFFSANEVLAEVQKISGLDLEREKPFFTKSLISSVDFVGREKEFATLKKALAQSAQNGNTFVLVTGESGIGKKRLVEEFATWAQLQGFSEITVSLKERDILEAFQDNPFQLLGVDSYPAVVVFEHSELADDSFFKFLSIFVGSTHGKKALVCFTLSDDLGGPEENQKVVYTEERIRSICEDPVVAIRLNRLTEVEVDRLVCSMFGSRERVERLPFLIHRETGGNPFLVGELTESLATEGRIRRENGKWSIELEHIEISKIPQRVRSETEKRLACLKPESAELIACASVWGLEIEFDDLAQLSDLGEKIVLRCLGEILSYGLMEESTFLNKKRFRFANNLIRRTVYDRIDSQRKGGLHEKAGELLEGKVDQDKESYIYDLAHHFCQARNTGKALAYSLSAAKRAESELDHAQAITHYTNALKLSKEIPTPSTLSVEEILESLADQFGAIGQFEKSLNRYQEALRLWDFKASDSEKQGLLYGKIGKTYERMSKHGEAVKFLEKSVQELKGVESPKQIATALVALGWVHLREPDYEKATGRFKEALNVLQKDVVSEERAFALSGLGTVHWVLGDYSHASWYHHEALKIFDELDDVTKMADCYGNLGIVARRRGQLKEATEFFRKCLDLLVTLQDDYRLSILYNNLGLTFLDLNNSGQALEHLKMAVELQERISDTVGLGFSYNNVGLVFLRQGDLSTASEYFNLAILQFRASRQKTGLALVYYNLGNLYTYREEFAEALRYLNKSAKIREELGEEAGMADCFALLGKVFLGQSDFGKALQSLMQAQTLYQKQRNKKAEAGVLLSLAEWSIKNNVLEQAEAHLTQARELLPQPDDKFLLGCFLRTQASVMKRIGDFDHSLNCLSDSAKVFKELQARLEIAVTYIEIGKVGLELKRYKEAKGFLSEASTILEREKIEAKKKEVDSLLEQIKDLKILENERITTFYQLAELLNNIWDTDELLARSLKLAIQLLNAERGAIIFYSDTDKSFEVKASQGIEQETSQDAIAISRQVLKDVVKSDSPLIVEDARKDRRFVKSQSVILYNILSILCVPLKTKSRLIGTVYLDHRSLPAIFSSEDVEFLKAFAHLIAAAIEKSELYVKTNEEIFQLKEVLHRTYEYPEIIGKSPQMQEVFNMVEKVANSKTAVLILGENGTGKELIANLIHRRSQRKDNPFVKVNCAALPETLLESELFGIEEKAATGVGFRKGKFELADGGTIFLDEIGDMSLSVQAKVLRVLQEKEFERVGGQRSIKIDVRVISATNMDLHKKIQEGSFRKDLYFRLNPIVIAIPPLRERKEDIPPLFDYFLKKFSKENNKPAIRLTKKIIVALQEYSWPGNVRELEHMIESAIVLSEDGAFQPNLLPQEVGKTESMINLDRYGKLQEVLDWVEKKKIAYTLEKNGWNQSKAAEELGISEPTLRRRMKEHNIKRTVRIRSS
jgi:Nif-specific regulatory protein